MQNKFSLDLADTISDLRFFPEPGQQNSSSFLLERMRRVYQVHGQIKKINDKKIIVAKAEETELINWLYRLIPQVTQLQEIIFNMDYSSMYFNQLEYVMDDMLDIIPMVLKEVKKQKGKIISPVSN